MLGSLYTIIESDVSSLADILFMQIIFVDLWEVCDYQYSLKMFPTKG